MITIDDAEIERLVFERAERTGQSVADDVRDAMRAQAAVAEPAPAAPTEVPPEVQARRLAALREFRETISRLPVLDPRSPDEILGYDENGLPT